MLSCVDSPHEGSDLDTESFSSEDLGSDTSSESGTEVEPNFMDVVSDVVATFALAAPVEEWVDRQRTINAAVNMCAASLHDASPELCMEILLKMEQLG